MKTGKILIIAFIAAMFGGAISAFTISRLNKSDTIQIIKTADVPAPRYATFSDKGDPQDFSEAAEKTVPAVVHVKVTQNMQGMQQQAPDILDFFFGPRNYRNEPQIREGSGSGVIISADGYIITNNHVIDGASSIMVALNDKTTLKAVLVGTDANTDVALLKVEKVNNADFPFSTFSDSDKLRLGQWVLAVGNPFNQASLTSTVTAGIISAKSRDLNISNNERRIESFLQTDAVVNPGSSGGALVNLKGELVGINTAIASRSGQYEGYAFAIPANIAKKVVEDLRKYGIVQRAMLGIRYIDLNIEGIEEYAKEEGIKNLEELKKHRGVYVTEVSENSAAHKAGIKPGDLLTQVRGKTVTSSSIISEEIGKLRPGDNIELTVIRDRKAKNLVATLKNSEGTTDKVEIKDDILSFLGADFKDTDKDLLKELNIKGGAQVKNITANGRLKQQGVKEGFIITSVNQKAILNTEELKKTMKQISRGGVFIEGIYPNGQEAYYAFGVK